MKTHNIELTDDQLTVVIALMHIGAAVIIGESITTGVILLKSVDDDHLRAREAQSILCKASDPTAWEKSGWLAQAENN